jgi:hypothetical protein
MLTLPYYTYYSFKYRPPYFLGPNLPLPLPYSLLECDRIRNIVLLTKKKHSIDVEKHSIHEGKHSANEIQHSTDKPSTM